MQFIFFVFSQLSAWCDVVNTFLVKLVRKLNCNLKRKFLLYFFKTAFLSRRCLKKNKVNLYMPYLRPF
uniref:Secreted protein n=1 Tax=Anguilla anguilla TaxID=7936 RepID=A0A0E9PAL8_ANGAN